jgi:hypothetical protein
LKLVEKKYSMIGKRYGKKTKINKTKFFWKRINFRQPREEEKNKISKIYFGTTTNSFNKPFRHVFTEKPDNYSEVI